MFTLRITETCMTHKKTLSFVEDQSIERLRKTSGWSYRVAGSYYTVKGPCPRCGAEGQTGTVTDVGPWLLPPDADVDARQDVPFDHPLPNTDVDVPVRCSCGSTHGEGRSGCGAGFYVRIGDLH